MRPSEGVAMLENNPVRGTRALTVAGADTSGGRLFIVNATVAGDVTVKLFDGSTHVITVPVGYTTYPYCVRSVPASAATATYAIGI